MWQPIETAPRNQTFLAVLNCAGEQTICTMRWAVAEAKNSRPDNNTFHIERVTHWMPLPELPGAQGEPKMTKPKIYCFLNVVGGGEGEAIAIAEDGTVLGSHWCSHDYYVPGDLGVKEGSRPDRHETYAKHYPEGYEMGFVPSGQVEKHEGWRRRSNLTQKENEMWQPIETAPKDQFLLLCGPSGYTTIPMVVTTGRMCSDYHAGRWIDHANDDLSDWGFEPTHWMPLPDPPGAQTQGEEK